MFMQIKMCCIIIICEKTWDISMLSVHHLVAERFESIGQATDLDSAASQSTPAGDRECTAEMIYSDSK